jgi:hypothetical protein
MLLGVICLIVAVSAQNIYLIPPAENQGKENGLSVDGNTRAQCLTKTFSSSTSFDIGYIIAQRPSDSK